MDKVHVVHVEARPQLASPDAAELAGAFINVYSTLTTQSAALEQASAEIAEAGWEIVSVEDSFWLNREEAEQNPDALPYFEQALIDGVVLVFHTYTHRGEQPDVLH